MPDEVDAIQDREQALLDRRIAEARGAARPHGAGTGICVDCREPIEPERLRINEGALRCAWCQSDHERRAYA